MLDILGPDESVNLELTRKSVKQGFTPAQYQLFLSLVLQSDGHLRHSEELRELFKKISPESFSFESLYQLSLYYYTYYLETGHFSYAKWGNYWMDHFINEWADETKFFEMYKVDMDSEINEGISTLKTLNNKLWKDFQLKSYLTISHLKLLKPISRRSRSMGRFR